MSQVTEQSVRFQTALASIKLIQASAVLDLTEDDFDFLTSNKVWIATDRSRARRCVEACVYGTLDFVGYPRFPAPVEFIAAVIAYYVHPVNIQTACLIMERSEERFSRNAETDLVCRLLLEKKKSPRSTKALHTVSIIGTGSYVPEKTLTNADLSRMVDTSDDWITTRTGIKERRIAAKDENTSDMAARAALKAIEQARISPKEIDLIMVATATPDMLFPATACFVQKKIGATNAACLDISAACAGFLFALEIAQQFITSHTHETVLVIGAEKLTSITNWTDRNSCVLFGDGAGAAILRHRGSAHGVISTHIGSDGQYTDILFMPGGGSRCPITRETADLHSASVHLT